MCVLVTKTTKLIPKALTLETYSQALYYCSISTQTKTTNMMTRQAMFKDMESKFKTALQELKISKDLNAQLLQEREESEAEITKIIQSNVEY